jgi:hypothetical protein
MGHLTSSFEEYLFLLTPFSRPKFLPLDNTSFYSKITANVYPLSPRG